jgi:hypothetical protein
VSFSGGGIPSHTTVLDVGATSELVDYAVTEELVPEPNAVATGTIAMLALALLRKKIIRG